MKPFSVPFLVYSYSDYILRITANLCIDQLAPGQSCFSGELLELHKILRGSWFGSRGVQIDLVHFLSQLKQHTSKGQRLAAPHYEMHLPLVLSDVGSQPHTTKYTIQLNEIHLPFAPRDVLRKEYSHRGSTYVYEYSKLVLVGP